MLMVLVVVHAFADVDRSPFVVVVEDSQLVNLVERDLADMDLPIQVANTDAAGSLDSEPVVLVNFYHLFVYEKLKN